MRRKFMKPHPKTQETEKVPPPSQLKTFWIKFKEGTSKTRKFIVPLLLLGAAATTMSKSNIQFDQLITPIGAHQKKILEVESLDDRLNMYRQQLVQSINGTQQSKNLKKSLDISKVLGREIPELTREQIDQITRLEKGYRKYVASGKVVEAEISLVLSALICERSNLIHARSLLPENDPNAEHNANVFKKKLDEITSSINSIIKPLSSLKIKQTEAEMNFLLSVMDQLTLDQRVAINQLSLKTLKQISASDDPVLKDNPLISLAKVLSERLSSPPLEGEENTGVGQVLVDLAKNDTVNFGDGEVHHSPFGRFSTSIMHNLFGVNRPKVFVLNFDGDMMASRVGHLRDEISTLLTYLSPNRGDRVVLLLQSPGGEVSSYGLATAELLRFKQAGVRLDICVDKVAASGGYMMAAVGDRVLASPFAILGSIGVVATMPNFSKRLEREGVSVEDITAGQFKRTLTPYKPPTPEDRKKLESDLHQTHILFKNSLKSNRPQLSVDDLATGETWFGTDALSRGLCDELCTSDEYLMRLKEEGNDVYFVKLKNKPSPADFGSLFGGSAGEEEGSRSGSGLWAVLEGAMRRLAVSFASELSRSMTSGLGLPYQTGSNPLTLSSPHQDTRVDESQPGTGAGRMLMMDNPPIVIRDQK